LTIPKIQSQSVRLNIFAEIRKEKRREEKRREEKRREEKIR